MKDFMETHPSVDQCQPQGGAKGSPKVLTIYCDGDIANIMDTRPTVVDTKPQPHGGAARKSPGIFRVSILLPPGTLDICRKLHGILFSLLRYLSRGLSDHLRRDAASVTKRMVTII